MTLPAHYRQHPACLSPSLLVSAIVRGRRISCSRLTDRSQLKLRYGHHHQQPQQQGHYNELDPFRSGVREPSKQFVEASHGQPPSVEQVITSTVDDGALHEQIGATRAGPHDPTDATNAGSRKAGPIRSSLASSVGHDRLAADPKKAHPRISTTSGMPNAMVAHISSFGHGTSAWDLISL